MQDPEKAGKVYVRVLPLATAVLVRKLGMGQVADMDKRGTSGKGFKKKEKERKGETPPNTQGLKPPKAQGWWESSTTGAPRRPREQSRTLGEGRGARERFPSPCRLAW